MEITLETIQSGIEKRVVRLTIIKDGIERYEDIDLSGNGISVAVWGASMAVEAFKRLLASEGESTCV